MSFSLSKKQLLGFATFTILFLGIFFFYYQITLNFIQSNEQVQQIQEGINQLEVVISLLKDAETGQRGYIITENSIFLEPYRQALSSLDTQINQLDSLLADNQAGKEKLNYLTAVIRQEIDRLQIGIR